MPKTADPAVKEALVEAAARLIAQHEALTTRRLATEVGASTMAVYTHFGSIEQLRRAVRMEGFRRLRDHLGVVEETDDPVADFCVAGWAYCTNAIENPHLYRVMFMETPLDDDDASVGLDTFETLVRHIQRCIDAGRFAQADPWAHAIRAWAMVHGASALHIAGMLQPTDVLEVTLDSAVAFILNFGDTPERLLESLDRSRRRGLAAGMLSEKEAAYRRIADSLRTAAGVPPE
jgi:AcrR family transcriptional regulator